MQSVEDAQSNASEHRHGTGRPSDSEEQRVAIVGMACRFPGMADSVDAYWQALVEGVNTATTIPSDRWGPKRFFHPDPDIPGRSYVERGAFLSQPLALFDAAFFRISPREAMLLDPQQRLLLEVAWEALEDSGLAPTIRGSVTGVYVGGFMLDHLLNLHGVLQRDAIVQHTAIADVMSMLSNRLSHAFDLRGPSLSVDTACSSSLVALHLACRALLTRECAIALCGGVNVMSRPEAMVSGSKAGLLSRDGLCKAFDAAADGYGRGEGAGIVVLKRLADALRDGDTIHAVIAGTGVNQDGHTDAITSPSPAAQRALIEQVLHDAGVAPDGIQYVEAHGTGTQAGDQAESYSVGTAIAARRSGQGSLWIGSAKTCIGHLEAAAGVAGVIKTVLALKHRTITPHSHFRHPNPAIDFESLRLRIPVQPEPWPATAGPAGAAVNSFGFGGTNAHAVLLEAPARHQQTDERRTRPAVFPISAASSRALASRIRQFSNLLRSKPAIDLNEIGYTQARHRSHHAYRTAFVARDAHHLLEQLEHAVDLPLPGDRDGPYGPGTGTIAFVYTGMGIQFRGMGAALFSREPAAKALLGQCESLWCAIGGAPFARLLSESSGEPITAPEQAQVANFALQIILTEVAATYGLRPACYVGHSVGEIAAAYAAGALSLEGALRILYHRSRLMARVSDRGAMLAVALSAVEIAPYLDHAAGQMDIAAFNGPHSVTLAGDADAIDRVGAQMNAAGVFNRRLNTDVAYHSHHLNGLENEFKAALTAHVACPSTARLYSTVVAGRIDPALQDGNYWWRNAREPVRWGDTLAAMLADGVDMFVELGPHPVLARTIADAAQQAGKPAKTFALQKRDQDGLETLLDGIGQLYCAGAELDWRAHYPSGRRVSLPPYPWDRERLWSETALSLADRLDALGHPLLSARAGEPQAAWDGEMATHLYPYLADHRVAGETVLPAAAAIEMALLAHPNLERTPSAIEQLTLHRSLAIDGSPLIRLQVDNDGKGFAIYSRAREPDAPWTRYASGQFGTAIGRTVVDSFDRAAWRADRSAAIDLDMADFYGRLNALGFDFGASFRCLRSVAIDRREAVGAIELAPAQAADAADYFVHPCLLDGALQAFLALALEQPAFASKMCLPVSIRQVRFFRSAGAKATCCVSMTEHDDAGATGSVTLFSADGEICVQLTGVVVRAIDAASNSSVAGASDWRYETMWEKQDLAASAPTTHDQRSWLVFCDASGVGEALIERARALGTTCIGIYADADRAARTPTSFVVNRGSREDIRRIATSIGAQPIDGIVYLWGLAQAHRVAGELARDPQQATGLTDVLDLIHTVQELQSAGHHDRLSLTVVSRQAQAVRAGETYAAPGQQALIALLRTLRAECATWNVKSIDIDCLGAAQAADIVLAEWADEAETEVAFRGAQRYVSRLVRVSHADRRRDVASLCEQLCNDDGSYLVTGGASGLGLATVQWLAKHGAKHIAILSRRGPTDAFAHETLAKLQSSGVAIWIVKCDVADATKLRGVLERLKTVVPPIRGVIHAAATLEDASLVTVADTSIESVFRAKAFGALNLHREFEDVELEWFITYSSISALLGNPGQAAYAAANGFLEGLVQWRRARSHSGTNVHWGAIRDVGMVARSTELQAALESQGLHSIDAMSGLTLLAQALDENRASLGIFDVDWPRWQAVHSIDRHDRRLARLLDTNAPEPADENAGEESLELRLQDAPAEQRWPLVYSLVTGTICKVLRISDTERVSGNSRLTELGLDSLLASELARTLNKRTGVPVSPLALLRGLSVAELSGYILKQV